MAHKVALINMKGGVGKSTLAANLAWAMATEPWSKRVLVVDLDPQFNCSQYLVGADRIAEIMKEQRPTVWTIMEQVTSVPGRPAASIDPADTIVHVYATRTRGLIDLIPSQLDLSQSLRNPAGKEGLLHEAIVKLEDGYDLVIIDCAPTDSMLTTAAYLASDYLLIPVRPEFLSSIGLPLLEQSLKHFDVAYSGQSPEVLGIVFNAMSKYAPEERLASADVMQIAKRRNWPIFENQIPYSRSFPKSAREGRPISRTSYTRVTVATNFRRFAREVAERLGLDEKKQ